MILLGLKIMSSNFTMTRNKGKKILVFIGLSQIFQHFTLFLSFLLTRATHGNILNI